MSVIDEWDYGFQFNFQDVDKERFFHFEKTLDTKRESIINVFDDGFKVKKFVYNGTLEGNNDEELRILIEKNKQLRHDIDIKIEELNRQQKKYERYKKDQKLLTQEVKETHEAFLMAKKCYKKFLKVYYSIEKGSNSNQTIYLQFFTEAKKDSENYSVRLSRASKTGQYELLSATPKLMILKELQRRLNETNDVSGVLCSIRKAFLAIRENKL